MTTPSAEIAARSAREVTGQIRAAIAAKSPDHAALVAAYLAIPSDRRSVPAWRQDHAAGIEEAMKRWPR